MSKEDWGLWAEEKPEPIVVVTGPEEPISAEYSVKVNTGGYLTGFGIGMPAGLTSHVIGKTPAIQSFLDSIQAFSRSARVMGKAADLMITIDSEMDVDHKLLEKLMLRMPKSREPSVKFGGFDSRFFLVDEASSFEDIKPNWAEARGLKSKGFQRKKQNDPKGNPVYGTTWRQKNERPK